MNQLFGIYWPIANAQPGIVTDVLMNWGANDFEAILDETTWKSQYLSMVDYCHGRFPNATIWFMRPWRGGYDVKADLLAGWIDDMVAARPSFTRLGPDERVWLKSNDNGATMTDGFGVHYSAAGATECAAQWHDSLLDQ